jgi:predicted DNA binding CopG/RHH family protein
MSNNPLQQYFRQPAIYIRLPSNGQFYPPGTLEPSPNGEYPVLPMTAVDEMTYRTPDALFNGVAVVSVIQSCLPNIKDAWAVPAVDVDTILVAIRIASYGHNMEFSTSCPYCNEESEREMDLRQVLDQIKAPDYTQPIEAGDMQIFFKPMTYKNLNDNNQLQFEEQKLLQLLPDTEVENVEKVRLLGDALKKLTEVTIKALTQSIGAVKTPTALVSEPEYIQEFLTNCDRVVFNRIRDFIIDIKGQAEMQPVKIVCDACSKEFEQQLTLDMTSFFAVAS